MDYIKIFLETKKNVIKAETIILFLPTLKRNEKTYNYKYTNIDYLRSKISIKIYLYQTKQ